MMKSHKVGSKKTTWYGEGQIENGWVICPWHAYEYHPETGQAPEGFEDCVRTFPAAMGAWAAAPDRKIIAVAGDGGFGQYLAEFTTAIKYKMPLTLILLNNNEIGKISKEFLSDHKEVWHNDRITTNFTNWTRIDTNYFQY